MNNNITFENFLTERLFINSLDAKKIELKHRKKLIKNGCVENEFGLVVENEELVFEYINNERSKKKVERKVFKVERNINKPNPDATGKQSEKLQSLYNMIMLKRTLKITDTELMVLSELILLTQHGLNNDISVNQAAVARNLSLSNQNTLKAIKRLVELNVIIKYKHPDTPNQTNNFSINLEKITGIQSYIK